MPKTNPGYTPKFYFNPEGFETKELYGKTLYRDASMAPGKWWPLPEPIDRLLDHIHKLTRAPSRVYLLSQLKLDSASVSRARYKELMEPVPLAWQVRMCDYTGLSLEQIRLIGGLKPWCRRWNEQPTNEEKKND